MQHNTILCCTKESGIRNNIFLFVDTKIIEIIRLLIYKTMKGNCEPGDCNFLKGVILNTAFSWRSVTTKRIWVIANNDRDMAKLTLSRKFLQSDYKI